MSKNFKVFSAIVVTVFIVCTVCFASEEYKVKLNGEYMNFDVAPVMIADRVLVPMRAIFEALGAEVDWDDTTQTATGTTEDTNVSITINEKVIVKNGAKTELDVPAQLVSSRTMVPIRAVSEAFECVVDWDGTENTVIISTALKNEEKVEKIIENEQSSENKETDKDSVLADLDIVKDGDMYKIYRKNGNSLIEGSFADVTEMNGLIIATNSTKQKSVYTEEGSFIGRGDSVEEFGNGLILLKGKDEYKYINTYGEVYSNIGVNKISELLNNPLCEFVLHVGKKRLVKRKEFEKYIEKTLEI